MPLSLPPLEFARKVGHSDLSAFDNLAGAEEFPGLDCSSVLDVGCGCGRIARRLLQQTTPPARYLGVDINKPMLDWCRTNLAKIDWEFKHMDIHNAGLNPTGVHKNCPIPAQDAQFTLAVAWSLFTHVIEAELAYSLGEVARCLKPGGALVSTWFLFDKTEMPFMQEFQNALYINLADPINAVVYDKEFLRGLFTRLGMTITKAMAPDVKGFQWTLTAVKMEGSHVEFPPDNSPVKKPMRPPT